MRERTKVLGQLLVDEGAITADILERALSEQLESRSRLGVLLVERGWTNEEAVARCLARQLNLPYHPPPLEADPAAVALVQPDLARRRQVVPLSAETRTLRLAMADPLDLGAVDDVEFQCGRRVEPVVASPQSVLHALAAVYGGGDLRRLAEELPRKPPAPREDETSALERAARSAPVVQIVDRILDQAIVEGASDIHIEAHQGKIRVRYRLDGLLKTVLDLPQESLEAVLSRLKIKAGMDISVKRRPQDGSVSLSRGGVDLTLRVSSLPTKSGEKAVVRVLDPNKAPWSLDGLGLSQEDLGRVRTLMKTGQGVVLAAGPTGSGKSSTLFAALAELDRDQHNLVTLEDPVEYQLPGANQVQVNPRAGLTFPAALRSVLRQDPDTIMVGEIRDRETAEIAMSAAVTGHLVLSTIHTVDAPGAITRLLNMGVPAYLVADGLAGVISQRLLRRRCRACGGRTAKGCGKCVGGYKGRTGVFQVLVMNDGLREAVAGGASLGALRRLAREAGMASLKEDALRKVAEGVTTPHEVGRVIQSDAEASLPCKRCGAEVPRGSEGCPWCGHRRIRRCACGRPLLRGWRFCPGCLRTVSL